MSAPALAVLPYVPGMVRAFLLEDATFSELCGGHCATRAPRDVTRPFARIQAPGGFPFDASAGAWSPTLQLDGWAAPAAGLDPEVAAWDIAVRGAALLSRVRNRPWQNAYWSVERIIDGPLPRLDESRGEDVPLYGAMVRAELRIKVQT